VASVKANTNGSHISTGTGLRNSRYSVENATLRSLLATAFRIPGSQIVGPEWIDSERFDVDAKAPAGTPDQQLPLMLQTLLGDRFRAAVHHEIREMPAYDLVVAKGGLKVQIYDPAHPPTLRGRPNLSGIGTISDLATQIAREIGQPVIDRTNALGRYAYALAYAPVSGINANLDRPDLFAAVEEQLGLKLVRREQGVKVLVIDHIERPTAN
jgi:uncharacterized protein (TIGR03435 family)